jgi:hypothetical protein
MKDSAMQDFVVPKIDTKIIGVPEFEYAFQVHAQLDPGKETKTTRGGRFFQSIAGGQVSGPRLNGTVYPHSGGAFSFIERDGVQELNSRFMIKADTTEWIYVEHRGYRRQDGYHRILAQFDADKQGKYASLNGGIWLAIAAETPGKNEVTFTYFEVV